MITRCAEWVSEDKGITQNAGVAKTDCAMLSLETNGGDHSTGSKQVSQSGVDENAQTPTKISNRFPELQRLFTFNGQVTLDILPEKSTLTAIY